MEVKHVDLVVVQNRAKESGEGRHQTRQDGMLEEGVLTSGEGVVAPSRTLVASHLFMAEPKKRRIFLNLSSLLMVEAMSIGCAGPAATEQDDTEAADAFFGTIAGDVEDWKRRQQERLGAKALGAEGEAAVA
jgi:hypothetical protein